VKNIIIGTAGHIDHGKTTLIKAITGRDTDRLKEEKERGISIELGFTYFDLPSGRRAGIVDVPGHEKFIKNMLAGIMGIDIVALVVAADEGVMPQTKEHLDILNLLNIDKGIVVVTKSDLVDDEWLSLVVEDIKEYLKGTFLENSAIIPVSSTTKKGIDEVIHTIDNLTENIRERDINETPRLPVDRIFSISGFGTIVTGTLIEGKFEVGDEIQVFPGNKKGRIRSIQVHGQDSNAGYGGQRVAINIAGLKKSEIQRGNVIAPVASMSPTMMVDVKFELLKSSQRIIENRTRLRLYIGSSEVLCRVVFLDRDQLTPGESCYAQLRLEEEVVAKRGDRFIIRFYSPMMTIGGGEIIESNPPKRKRFDAETIKELELKEKGDIEEVVEKIIHDKSKDFLSVEQLSVLTVLQESKLEDIINKLLLDGKVVVFNLQKDKYVIHNTYFIKLTEKIVNELKIFHQKYPLKSGMAKEELRSRYFSNLKPRLGETYINKLIQDEIIVQINESVALKGFEVKFNDLQLEIKNSIEEVYLSKKFSAPKIDELFESLKYNKDDIQHVFDALLDSGILVKIKEDNIIHKEVYNEAINLLKQYIVENGSINVAQLRDLLNSNRKMAISMLEYCDDKKITKRIEDRRIIY